MKIRAYVDTWPGMNVSSAFIHTQAPGEMAQPLMKGFTRYRFTIELPDPPAIDLGNVVGRVEVDE